MDTLSRVHDAEKLGLDNFPLVEASIAALVQAHHLRNQKLFAARLGNYNGILVAFQSHLLQSLSENHRLSPQELDELHLVNYNLLRLSKLNGQAVGRNLATLISSHMKLWHSEARVPDVDKAQLFDVPITDLSALADLSVIF
ncbi:UNVERIFIED_CONTAM: hypothetical protein FKN15_005294 [Acipenser sinensis]